VLHHNNICVNSTAVLSSLQAQLQFPAVFVQAAPVLWSAAEYSARVCADCTLGSNRRLSYNTQHQQNEALVWENC
jgi:hypothetical protein